MQPTRLKRDLLLISWLVFTVLVFSSLLLIGMAVGAFYHPNSKTSPYYEAIITIYPIVLIASLLLAVWLSIARKRLSTKAMGIAIGATYTAISLGVLVTMLQVEPVPNYFIRYVGDVPYRIPREFTAIQGNQPGPDSGLRIDICLDTFQGKYSSGAKGCRSSIVTLSQRAIVSDSFNALYFFKRSNEFSNVGDQIKMTGEAPKYQVQSPNEFRSYIAHLDNSRESYFQINESNNLIRFASCHSGCRSFVKTRIGTLQYPYQVGGFSASEFEQWVSMEKKLINLISSWREGQQ